MAPPRGPRPIASADGAPLGHQKSGGRQKGTRNRLSSAVRAALNRTIEDLAEQHLTPLDVMLKAMRQAVHDDNWPEAVRIAALSAPYCHARLASIAVKQTVRHELSEAQMLAEIDSIAKQFDLPIVVLDHEPIEESRHDA